MPSTRLFQAYSAAAIRAAEQPLIKERERVETDGLMQTAARGLSEVILGEVSAGQRVLLLVGSGGNGGDALYAGSIVAAAGLHTEALAVRGTTHPSATAAYTGTWVTDPQGDYDLIVDGITGLGASCGIDPHIADWLEQYRRAGARVLAVDIPSGLDPDTGQPLGEHVRADITVTFGCLRGVHLTSAYVGQVYVVDIGLRENLAQQESIGTGWQSVQREGIAGPQVFTEGGRGIVGPKVFTLPTPPLIQELEPRAWDHKYSTGVCTIFAGSQDYPGAAVLVCRGAAQATSGMVRYLGPVRELVLATIPEVVTVDGLSHSLVIGPGGCTSGQLEQAISCDIPLLCDAAALGILARSPQLQQQLRARTAVTVLTPHSGEFAAFGVADPQVLANSLLAIIVLKGRKTQLYMPEGSSITSIDAGHSWAATPGSGDVLAGVMGAWLARAHVREDSFHDAIVHAVDICNKAGWIAAQTSGGPAPITANSIATALPQAIAQSCY
ncbi:bifunctional ADP-dependent NAD(P)H-hydrate dehydratase/NAD(P)H-hydrate epimerase [Corynebacterium sp. HS2168-gen11]|uniref:bifunctional ADP-dependent NAD(P)H-hydrate dehydratase/NAD(P)H-hydrate epimerase n=1 Tax=Corynebacterium sp. HS2168-gen11 TaxID=2974027 RepID=UPI00216AD851|nr:bifunctional ADP-dependent NAD(P)H-hydrate dehydratase/NAD(P)H-hydrate epimerase [Corynebacterium sp. HS2168-gen11]MCS4536452.1 bifunctional ADP-dependent NAD(P)H-hydrate dehydratase/NAD(P)H-hydrate epimerase [Corynebacterium sp. HS2168-gen11]